MQINYWYHRTDYIRVLLWALFTVWLTIYIVDELHGMRLLKRQ